MHDQNVTYIKNVDSYNVSWRHELTLATISDDNILSYKDVNIDSWCYNDVNIDYYK